MRSPLLKSLAASLLVLATVCWPAAMAGEHSALNQIALATQDGTISLKESVLLRAKLLYDPNAFLTPKEERVAGGMDFAADRCGTEFFKDLHRVFEELTPGERFQLSTLSDEISNIIAVKTGEESGHPLRGALPTFSDLDLTEEGDKCVVHYSLTSKTNKAPDKDYAVIIKKAIEDAMADYKGKKFKAALCEGDAKLHVYVMNLGGSFGEWVDISAKEGKAKAGYVKITSDLQESVPKGGDWELYLKSTTGHEYFHGVQSAYNWESSLWFMEGTAVWTELFFLKNEHTIKDTFSSTLSIFNTPSLPLWSNTYHKYSTVAYAYYLSDNFGGANFIRSYFEGTAKESDAIVVLKQLLKDKKTTFEGEFKEFLAELCLKKIKSLKDLMPDMKATTVSSYGYKSQVEFGQLGCAVYRFQPQDDIKSAPLLCGVASSKLVGVPSSFALPQGKIVDVVNGKGRYTQAAKLGGAIDDVFFIVTDAEYSKEDAVKRAVEVNAVTPFVKITDTMVNPKSITLGEKASIDITYDLLGTHADEKFPMQVAVEERAPGSKEKVSGEKLVDAGQNMKYPTIFGVTEEDDPAGIYRFVISFAVPADSWKTSFGIKDTVSTKTSFSVKVTR